MALCSYRKLIMVNLSEDSVILILKLSGLRCSKNFTKKKKKTDLTQEQFASPEISDLVLKTTGGYLNQNKNYNTKILPLIINAKR